MKFTQQESSASRVTACFTICLLITGCEASADRDAARDGVDGMRLVPGATFRMGTDSIEFQAVRLATGLSTIRPMLAEVPSHVVSVNGFYIDTVLVTNEQFAHFVVANPQWSKAQVDSTHHNGRYLEHWTETGPPARLLDHPVTFVTWQAAVSFCESRGKRLPSEREFEWAAQDGVTRSAFPWGDAPPADSLVNWSGNGINSTVPIASYGPNARGLYDMAGNVWQFTSDPWRGSYGEMLAHPAEKSEVQSDQQNRRVVRGGSWGANAANMRVRYRDSHREFDAREIVGFRCARSANHNQ